MKQSNKISMREKVGYSLGEVAARAAMVFKYIAGRKQGPQPFPALKSLQVSEHGLLLTFDQPMREGRVTDFEVADASGRFHNVEATAKGSSA